MQTWLAPGSKWAWMRCRITASLPQATCGLGPPSPAVQERGFELVRSVALSRNAGEGADPRITVRGRRVRARRWTPRWRGSSQQMSQVFPPTETVDDGSSVPSLPSISWKVRDSGTLAKPLVGSRVKLARMGLGGNPFGTN